MKTDDTKLIDKIAKLLKKSDSSKAVGSLHEAEAFLDKATKLMLENNLSFGSIESHMSRTEATIIEAEAKYGGATYDGSFEVDLATVIASHNLCKVLYNRYHKSMTFIGRVDNVQSVMYMYEVARDVIRNASRSTYNKLHDNWRDSVSYAGDVSSEMAFNFMTLHLEMLMTLNGLPMKRKPTIADVIVGKASGRLTFKDFSKFGAIPLREVYIRNFLKGAVHGIDVKLYRMIAQSESATQWGIVKTRSTEEIDSYLKDIEIKSTRMSNKIGNARAFNSGYKTGLDCGLNKAVGSVLESNTLMLNQ